MEIGSSTPNLQSTDAQVPYSWSSVFTDAEPMDLEGQLYHVGVFTCLGTYNPPHSIPQV